MRSVDLPTARERQAFALITEGLGKLLAGISHLTNDQRIKQFIDKKCAETEGTATMLELAQESLEFALTIVKENGAKREAN